MSIEKKINLHSAEEVIQVVRRHGVVYFWHYLLGLGIMIVKSFLMFWLFAQGWWGYAVFIAGMILGIFIIARAWFHHRQNLAVITSERVVDVHRPGWFSEAVSPVGHLDIQDVFVEKRGIWASIFNYGNVIVRSKNNQTVLCLEHVPEPHRVADAILSAREKHRQNRRLASHQAVYNSFVKILPELSEAELCEVQDLANDQLAKLDAGDDVEEMV